MSRKTARVHAFHLIFQFPYHGDWNAQALAASVAHYYEGLEEGKKPRGRDAAYVNRAVVGTFERQAQLDGVIGNFLQDWTIERLNRVDLAIMRLAIYEMLCEPDVPPAVAVNEAVELAKTYGAGESPAFVNGVLANVAREIKDG